VDNQPPDRRTLVFKSNAVRSLVELHEMELMRFYDVWERFCACGTAIARLARRRTVAVPAFRAALMWNMETS
jgi:hypothetical protein